MSTRLEKVAWDPPSPFEIKILMQSMISNAADKQAQQHKVSWHRNHVYFVSFNTKPGLLNALQSPQALYFSLSPGLEKGQHRCLLVNSKNYQVKTLLNKPNFGLSRHCRDRRWVNKGLRIIREFGPTSEADSPRFFSKSCSFQAINFFWLRAPLPLGSKLCWVPPDQNSGSTLGPKQKTNCQR